MSEVARPSGEHARRRAMDQRGFEVRFGWGPNGLRRLAPEVDAVVIVDVLSFSTAVDVALGNHVTIFPYRWHNGTEHEFAASVDALVADRDGSEGHGYTLRPSSLAEAPAGLRLVLPSPNGSALTFGAAEAGATDVFVGSLRNATAVARALDHAESVAVIAAGERWNGATGPLRPCTEDLLGAGSIIEALGRRSISPEARVAAAAAADLEPNELRWAIRECGSGRELRIRGYDADVELAAHRDASAVVPKLQGHQLIDAAADRG